jgi:hypothetical protein
MIALLRRATALRELGQYEKAYADLETIHQFSPLSNESAGADLKGDAEKLKQQMKRDEKQSDACLRGFLNTALTSKQIFSSNRESPISSDKKEDEDIPRTKLQHVIKKLHMERNARINTNNIGKKDITPSKLSDKKLNSVKEKKKTVLLDMKTVSAIQAEQFEIFSSPEVLTELEKLRFDSDYEEQRFLYRLKPFKLKLQVALLEKYHFAPSAEGLTKMERAIAHHITATQPQVGEECKKLMILVMGDIWS